MPTKVVWQIISSDWRMKFQKLTPSLPTGGWVSRWDRFRKRVAQYMWGISRVSAMTSRGQSIEWCCTSFAVSCEDRSQPNMYVRVPGSNLGHTVCANSPDLKFYSNLAATNLAAVDTETGTNVHVSPPFIVFMDKNLNRVYQTGTKNIHRKA